MNPTLDNLVESSLFLWLDNLLVQKGAGFTNFSGQFSSAPSSIVGWNAYAIPQRQMVYDSSISGVQIPTGVFINNNFSGASSNLYINYNEGCVFSQTNLNNISAPYSFKDVNIYFTSQPEEKVLFEKGFSLNPRTSNTYTSLPTDPIYPCIFIKMMGGSNKTLTFDKLSSTIIPARLMFLADTSYLYRAVCSMLRDTKERFLPIFQVSQMPFNFYGGLVSGSFNFLNMQSLIQQNGNNLLYIKDVRISDFSDQINSSITPRVIGGIIDLDLESLRYPASS